MLTFCKRRLYLAIVKLTNFPQIVLYMKASNMHSHIHRCIQCYNSRVSDALQEDTQRL